MITHGVRAGRGHFARERHQDEPVAVLQQFPVVILSGRAARRFDAPLPDRLAVPRQLTDRAVVVDAASRIRR
ncbi:hypothetical protein A5724_15085 [Mycobacterium sp. ACS1612]|nr:hypothetical protein A5724_15085 [Mycobacterium sp. ACS1612]